MPCMLRDKKLKKIAEKILGAPINSQKKKDERDNKHFLKYDQSSRKNA